MQSLCTLRDHCRQGSRNTRYQAGAAPYLDRSSTGWITPACLAHSFDHLVGAGEHRRGNVDVQCLGGLQVDRSNLVPRRIRMRPARRSATTQFDAGRAARRGPRLLRRDVGDPHDLAPLLGFSGDEGSELLGIERHRHLAGIGEACLASIVGSASTAPISRSRRAMTAAGVPLGAPTPAQVLASYPGNASAIVGTSGSASKRRLPATASARSAPVRTCGSEVTITSKPICTWPASRSVIMDAPPR